MAKSAELISNYWNSVESEPETPTVERELGFGQYLRRQRVLRGITRDEVLRVTKVSPEYYDALESNRFERLPPKAFVMGFLRVLSTYAGLDGDEVINRYLMELAQQDAKEEATAQKESFWRRNYRRLLFGFGLLCLGVLMFSPLL